MKACLVVYDIPSTPVNGERLANPSDMFKQYGVRINYSCWVVPSANLPLMPLKELEDKGAKIRVVQFDEDEKEKLIALATEELTKEVSSIKESMKKIVVGIKARYKDAEKTKSDKDFDKAYSYHYLNMRRMKQLIVSVQQCAMAFDLTGDFTELFDGLRKALQASDLAAYNSHASTKKAVGR